ncbi:glycine zipper 2TM domain-containing protein [Mycobacterium shimoidei]|uniref:Glycine zipper 2TM domain-containing protein n=1 Tax=Mycobacterium shimoidei TaxID=29313 RepID=A0A1E3SXY6_MYCSH|nr:glycine zipper 2TM domain-containing protein [Mycobacterium shimoidei]MCV7257077.1 glycine zipper 2TM domain-containing protein [Mycobacterium shimoidei]ODR06979.1 DUF4126 domain-containing protein [Mycobacterium shimoidei]ORW76869.1 hypothetical protein AWC26_01025 [Mycobacterium shimoidei]SRX94984.1 hypothetical protein MSP7336_03248 [Mycobacterium shimoidei]
MTHVYVLLLALLIGVVAGLRSLTAPAVVAWAAVLHWINLDGTWAAWVGHPITVAVLSILAVGELVLDKLPKAPSRTSAPSFAARIVLGAFAGAVIGTAWGYKWGALGAGAIGAVLGTLGGYEARTRLASRGRDLPVALLEDAVAVLGGFAIAATTGVL